MSKTDGIVESGDGHRLFFSTEDILHRHPFFAIAKRSVRQYAFLLNIDHTWLHQWQRNDDRNHIKTRKLRGVEFTRYGG